MMQALHTSVLFPVQRYNCSSSRARQGTDVLIALRSKLPLQYKQVTDEAIGSRNVGRIRVMLRNHMAIG